MLRWLMQSNRRMLSTSSSKNSMRKASSSVGGNTSTISPRTAHWPLAFHHRHALVTKAHQLLHQRVGRNPAAFLKAMRALLKRLPPAQRSSAAFGGYAQHADTPGNGVVQHLQPLPGALAAGGGAAELHVAAGQHGGGDPQPRLGPAPAAGPSAPWGRPAARAAWLRSRAQRRKRAFRPPPCRKRTCSSPLLDYRKVLSTRAAPYKR